MSVKKNILFFIIIIVVLFAFIILYDRKNSSAISDGGNAYIETPAYRTYPMMGTWAEISLYGNTEEVNKAFDRIQKVFNDVNNTCSRFKKDSELSQLNRTASEKPFKCDDMLWDILIKSKLFYEMSSGSFDITVPPLMELWGFYRKQNKIPSALEIKQVLKKVGLSKVVFNKRDHSVFFKTTGMKIDLGGIAKGYAVDLAYESVRSLNIKAGVINLGGNIRTFSSPPPGRKSYLIGVRDPFARNKIMNGTMKVLGKSLATSGDYEQYVIIDGERFTHIIDPRTGYPVKDMAADTIICKNALWADALSTSVFLNGEQFAQKIHEAFPEISILVVRGNKDVPSTIKIFKFGKIWEQIEEPLAEYTQKN
jgi:FAD:protein FMN transferase